MTAKGPFLFEIRLEALEDSTSRQAYNDLYSETSLSQIESFYIWNLRQIDAPPGATLLDVSCGAGEFVHLAAQHGYRASGVDISETIARTAARRTRGLAPISVGAGETLPFADASFDVVTSIGSLEHYLDPGQGAYEMARVLKPGGRAYILVPNTFSLLSNVWNAYRKGLTSVDDQPLQRYGARLDWTILLEQNGFKVTRTLKYERPWPYHRPDWGHYLRKPKELLRMIAGPFVPLNLAFCFVFVCQRAQA